MFFCGGAYLRPSVLVFFVFIVAVLLVGLNSYISLHKYYTSASCGPGTAYFTTRNLAMTLVRLRSKNTARRAARGSSVSSNDGAAS